MSTRTIEVFLHRGTCTVCDRNPASAFVVEVGGGPEDHTIVAKVLCKPCLDTYRARLLRGAAERTAIA